MLLLASALALAPSAAAAGGTDVPVPQNAPQTQDDTPGVPVVTKSPTFRVYKTWEAAGCVGYDVYRLSELSLPTGRRYLNFEYSFVRCTADRVETQRATNTGGRLRHKVVTRISTEPR